MYSVYSRGLQGGKIEITALGWCIKNINKQWVIEDLLGRFLNSDNC
jgi:hypothetical protein